MRPCFLSSAVDTVLTKPSSRRISAMRSFMFERGSSMSCLRARIPLRMRARKSAIGSVIDIFDISSSLPARLDDARDVAAQRELAEAEATHLELTEIGARPTTTLAAALHADLELLLLRKPIDQLAHAAAPVPVAGAA